MTELVTLEVGSVINVVNPATFQESFFPGSPLRRFQWIILMFVIFSVGFSTGTWNGFNKGYGRREEQEMPALFKILQDYSEKKALYCTNWADMLTCQMQDDVPSIVPSVLIHLRRQHDRKEDYAQRRVGMVRDSPRPTQRTSGFERCQLQQRNSLLRSWRGQEHYQRTSV